MPPDDRNGSGDGSGPVGYGNPPRHTRFEPGKPRRRGGRRRGTENRKTVVARVVHERHAVMENGKRRWRSALGLVLLLLRNRAAEGDPRAFRAYHDCLVRFGPQNAKKVGGYLVVPEVLSEAEFEKESEKVTEYQRTLTWDPK